MCTILRAAAQSHHGDDECRSSDEDDEALQRARAFDEFKDGKHVPPCEPLILLRLCLDHRRGDGNKKGKG